MAHFVCAVWLSCKQPVQNLVLCRLRFLHLELRQLGRVELDVLDRLLADADLVLAKQI